MLISFIVFGCIFFVVSDSWHVSQYIRFFSPSHRKAGCTSIPDMKACRSSSFLLFLGVPPYFNFHRASRDSESILEERGSDCQLHCASRDRRIDPRGERFQSAEVVGPKTRRKRRGTSEFWTLDPWRRILIVSQRVSPLLRDAPFICFSMVKCKVLMNRPHSNVGHCVGGD